MGLIHETDTIVKDFNAHYGINGVWMLPQSKFRGARELLHQKRERK
jgi:hypothetical protein